MTKKKPIGSDLSDLPMRPLRPGEKWQPDIRTKMPEYVERPATPEEVAMLPGDTAPSESRSFLECLRCGSTRIEVRRTDGSPGFVQDDPSPTKCRDCGNEASVGAVFRAICKRAGGGVPPVFPRGTLRGLGLHAQLERPCRIHCPWCGSEDIETTLMGGILIDFTPAKQMRDSNRATCASCRHQGNAGDWFAIEYWKAQA